MGGLVGYIDSTDVNAFDGREMGVFILSMAILGGKAWFSVIGDMKEKVDPYLRPIYDSLYDMLRLMF